MRKSQYESQYIQVCKASDIKGIERKINKLTRDNHLQALTIESLKMQRAVLREKLK